MSDSKPAFLMKIIKNKFTVIRVGRIKKLN
jgi:hypothetical protein